MAAPPKENPPEAGAALSAGFAPKVVPAKSPPAAGVALLGSAGGAPNIDGALEGSVDGVEVEAAGLAAKEKRLPLAGGGAEGVDEPAAVVVLFEVAVEGGSGVVGLAPNRPPLPAVLVESAGLAPNRLPVGVAVPEAAGADALFDPNRLIPPVAGAAAPNRPPLAGGGAAGVVDCPNPPNAGFAAGVDVPAALAFPPNPPKRFPEDAGALDDGVLDPAVDGF